MSESLSNRDVQADVKKALLKEHAYVSDLVTRYKLRNKSRKAPILAFCGNGRAGKDCGGSWLGANYALDYGGSLSQIVCPLIATALEVNEAECFATRHANRKFWYDFCNLLRRAQPTLLAEMLLSKADIVTGIRDAEELEACLAEGVVDLAIWVENNRVACDPTVTYVEADCDLSVCNSSTKCAYFQKLRKLADLINLPKRIPTVCNLM